MKVGYIKHIRQNLKIIDKIKYFLGMVNVCEYEQGCVFQIPIFKKDKKIDKVLLKLCKKIKKTKVDTVVLSNECVDGIFYDKLKLMLQQNGTTILTGKKLMNYMNYDILEYIFNIQKTTMKQEEIFFLIQKDESLDLQFLSRFIENCKTVNIVTNDMGRFKKIQESLYEKENILISVSNNKNKALKRAEYILNVNMEKKEMDKFKINRNAIIINFKDNTQYTKPAFDGIYIHYFKIKIPDEYIEKFEKINDMEQFDIVRLYETVVLQQIMLKEKVMMLSKRKNEEHRNVVADILKDDEVRITGLIGNNGEICQEEFIKNKGLTKNEN